jgi:hypothetical protein
MCSIFLIQEYRTILPPGGKFTHQENSRDVIGIAFSLGRRQRLIDTNLENRS